MDLLNTQRRESAPSSHRSISSTPSNRNVPARPIPPSHGSRQSTIRLRRFPSASALNQQVAGHEPSSSDETGRRRSASDPQRANLHDVGGPGSRRRGLTATLGHEPLPEIVEGAPIDVPPQPAPVPPPVPVEKKRRLRKYRGRFFRRSSNGSVTSVPPNVAQEEYESGLVDVLDLVDPEVSTLNTLTNVQNSLFVPNLGRFINRRPTYTLTRRDEDKGDSSGTSTPDEEDYSDEEPSDGRPDMNRTQTLASITSRPDDSHYAVLPHGVALEGWNSEDRKQLNDHVRHMLHSKRSRFKRSLKGFKQYVSHPLGFFITLYATLITLFGTIWVLFLIGWISVGSRKDYIINVIDNILVALFAIMGDGLAPFRTVDTYHMCFIAYYHHLTKKVRRIRSLPPLRNHNDLPTARPIDLINQDIEAAREMEKPGAEEFSVLTDLQQKRLIHHQEKFAKSHTFYKPHETSTHYAFPIRYLIAAVILLDLHSCLQISLGACTWGISYHDRPFALTTVILCCSITVNITAGIVIMFGDRRTRKKDVLELMHKQELTAEAMRKLERNRERERRRNCEEGLPVPPPLGTDTVGVDSVDDINRSPTTSSEDNEKRNAAGSNSGAAQMVEKPMIEKSNPLKRKESEVEPFPAI